MTPHNVSPSTVRAFSLSWIFCLLISSPLLAKDPLTVNWHHTQRYLQPVVNAFMDETGIAVEITNDWYTFSTDVLFVADYKQLVEAKNLGKLQPLRTEFFSSMSKIVPEQWRDVDGYWLGAVYRVRTAVVNNNEVGDNEKPTHLMDLAKPEWQDRMTIRNGANVYNRSWMAYLIYRYGEAAATRWAEGIVRNFGQSNDYSSDTENAKLVATGEFAISFLNTYYLGYLQTQKGTESEETLRALRENLDVVWLDGGEYGIPVNLTGIGISSQITPQKLSDAEKFVAFILSRKGQALMSEHVFKYPVRRDVAPSEYLRQFGEFKIDEFNINDLRYFYSDADRIMKTVGWNY